VILLQEELVSRALTEAGQVFIDPRLLRFDDERVRRDILEPCMGEYRAFRPPTVWEHLNVPTDGWPIPSRVRRINGLRPLWLYYWPHFAAAALRPIPRMEAQRWFVTNNVLYAPPGRYELEYISNEGYRLSNEVDRYIAHEVFSGESATQTVDFYLRVKPRPGTVKIHIGDELTAEDDGSNTISGDFIDIGVIDYNTCKISLDLDMTNEVIQEYMSSDGKISLEVEFMSVNPGVYGLDWSEIYFYFLFASKFLPAFATTRSIVRVEGVPIDMNVDGFLEYARQKEQEWLQSKEMRQSWWRW